MMEFESVTLFEISTLELIKMESFMQLKNSLTLEPKMPFMGIFRLKFENNIVIFDISILESV